MASVLSYGPAAVLSHRTAVAIWELRPSSSPIIEVTVLERGRKARGGIRLHRVRSLHPGDVTVRERIPISRCPAPCSTSPRSARAWELERAVDEAERRAMFDLREIWATIERNPGRRGVEPLLALLAQFKEAPPVRSDFERDFLDLCAHAGLELPLRRRPVSSGESP